MNILKDNDNGVQVIEETVISIRYRRQSADCARHVFPWYKTESYRWREQRAYTYIALSPFVFDRMNFFGGSRDICEARDTTVYEEKNDGWLKVEILIKFKLQAAENQEELV